MWVIIVIKMWSVIFFGPVFFLREIRVMGGTALLFVSLFCFSFHRLRLFVISGIFSPLKWPPELNPLKYGFFSGLLPHGHNYYVTCACFEYPQKKVQFR